MTNKCFPKITYGMITCLAIFSSTGVMAESETFKRAVKVFKQGYNECTEAQRIRSQDINQATEKFSKYLEMKDKAAELDASILTTTLHNISREIEYCEKAQQDILRSKAFPIMETALEACKKSKEQLAKSNTVDATGSYKKYEELYQKAIDVTPSIAKVSSVQIKVGRCNKLKKKIVEAETKLTKIKAAYALDHKTISSALESCNSARSLLTGNNPSQKNIAKAKTLLNESKTKLGNITNKRESAGNKKYASLRINQQITNKISSTKKCNTSLVSSISNADSLRKNREAARIKAARAKLEKDRIAAEKLKEEQKKKDEAERLAKEAELAEAKRAAEEKRLAALKNKEQQQLEEQEALKRKQAEDEARKRELAKERLKNKRKSQNWSSSVGSDGASNAKGERNESKTKRSLKKDDDWRSLAK